MSHFNQFHPWCIIRHLPKMQRIVVGRFRHGSEAEAHLKVLRQITPDASYAIVFDTVDDRLDVPTSDVVIERWLGRA